MTDRTYPHGVPCWVDTEQPDVEAATKFYGGLFGWTFEDVMPPGAPGRYLIATLDGRDVAAIAGPGTGDAAWNTYVAVDEADAATQHLVGLGATVVSAPADAGEGGRAAMLADLEGAELRIWQARRRLGGAGRQRTGNVELQRPAHRGPALGDRVLRGGVRVVLRRPGLRDPDPPARLRRPPRGDRRPGHPGPPGRGGCPARLRGRDRPGSRRPRRTSVRIGTSRSPSPTGTRRSATPSASGPTSSRRTTPSGRAPP